MLSCICAFLHTSSSACDRLLTTLPRHLSPEGGITAEWVPEGLSYGCWHSNPGLATGGLDKLLNLTVVSFSPTKLWDYKTDDLNRLGERLSEMPLSSGGHNACIREMLLVVVTAMMMMMMMMTDDGNADADNDNDDDDDDGDDGDDGGDNEAPRKFTQASSPF